MPADAATPRTSHFTRSPKPYGRSTSRISEIADVNRHRTSCIPAKLQYLGIAVAMRRLLPRNSPSSKKVEMDFQSPRFAQPLHHRTFLCHASSGFLQEALHNSAKLVSASAGSKKRLWGTSDEIHLTVKDSGAGFDREAASESRGLGLISMEERLKLVKGTFSINSQPKRGTTIHARVPLSSGGESMRAAR